MADLGATLQNARTSAGLEISDIEAETKIRAKYLRALEQEEWDQLPGPTYVRSFLRTYAEALGLDGRMMVEQYRLRHEEPSDQDLMPIGPPRTRTQRRDRRTLPKGAVVAAMVIALLAALWWLGSQGSGDDAKTQKPKPAASPPSDTATTSSEKRKPKRATTVKLSVRATGTVFVCMRDATGKIIVDGQTLVEGEKTKTFRSRAFRVRLGNGNARLVVNGRSRKVADISPQAYRVSPAGVRRIELAQSPECQPG